MNEVLTIPAILLGLYCQPDVNNCDIYRCAHTTMQCDTNHDLLKFSEFYCEKFINLNDRFSPQTQNVLAEIRYCLQYELAETPNLTCRNSRSIIASHHEKCYLNSDFCGLPFKQKWQIFRQIKPTLKERDYRKTFRKIFKACLFDR